MKIHIYNFSFLEKLGAVCHAIVDVMSVDIDVCLLLLLLFQVKVCTTLDSVIVFVFTLHPWVDFFIYLFFF